MPLFQVPGCRFVDLQYSDTVEERAQLARECGQDLLRLDDIDNTNDIEVLPR